MFLSILSMNSSLQFNSPSFTESASAFRFPYVIAVIENLLDRKGRLKLNELLKLGESLYQVTSRAYRVKVLNAIRCFLAAEHKKVIKKLAWRQPFKDCILWILFKEQLNESVEYQEQCNQMLDKLSEHFPSIEFNLKQNAISMNGEISFLNKHGDNISMNIKPGITYIELANRVGVQWEENYESCYICGKTGKGQYVCCPSCFRAMCPQCHLNWSNSHDGVFSCPNCRYKDGLVYDTSEDLCEAFSRIHIYNLTNTVMPGKKTLPGLLQNISFILIFVQLDVFLYL